MNMHNNDIDALFRAKLDDFEAEPPARVWANIDKEINGTHHRRKAIIPLLRIAASVAVLIAAGLFFIPRNNKKATHKQYTNRVVKTNVLKPQVIAPDTTVQQPANPGTQLQQAAGMAPQQQLAVVRQVKNKIQAVTTTSTQPAHTQPGPEAAIQAADNQQALMAAVQNKVPVNKPVVPDAQVSLKAVVLASPADSQPASVMAAANPADNDDETDAKPVTTPAKKHKAHGFGSILNAMIGVVDKRQDKIIEFTDTDEGDSVTGINLGIIKIKKQK